MCGPPPTVGAGALPTVMVTATPAAAHAELVRTDPVDGDVVPTAPARIVLTFNEPVSAMPEATTGPDAGGAPQPVTVRVADSSLQITPDAVLANGTYIVTWRVMSADSHPVSGAFTFSVGAPSPQLVPLPDQSAPAGVVWARGTAQGSPTLACSSQVGWPCLSSCSSTPHRAVCRSAAVGSDASLPWGA